MQLMVKSEWVKFVAIQHRSATLIYDLITMKGTGESYFKKIRQSFKTAQFQDWKSHLQFQKTQKIENCFEAPLKELKNADGECIFKWYCVKFIRYE